jgi:hypothetical protein
MQLEKLLGTRDLSELSTDKMEEFGRKIVMAKIPTHQRDNQDLSGNFVGQWMSHKVATH